MTRATGRLLAKLVVLTSAVTAGLAGTVDPNDVLVRTFVDVTPGADFESGNFEHRRDTFTNSSAQLTLTLSGIEVLLLNPEDVGFDDLEPSTVTAVVAAAEQQFPEYHHWGTSYWNFPGNIPPLDVPPVEWVFAEFPGASFPIVVSPGETFMLETVAHNNLFGPVNPPPERIGELVIGWRFLTELCGNGIVETGEECDDGNADDTDGCRSDCTIPRCGDGIVDSFLEESCDDGNTDDTDGCRSDCTIPVCGDGIVDGFLGEECDDANADDTDGCRGDCTIPRCGDGIVDSFLKESCDDGNLVDDDACRNDCTIPICGDGIVDAQLDETCDPPGVPAGILGLDCRQDCTVCGDGVTNSDEECDDGNDVNEDGCRNDCSLPFCGDQLLDPGETCDPPGQPSGAIGNDCRVDCTVCGDGIVDIGEDCDDGNASDTDLCRNDCTELGIVTRNAAGVRSILVDDIDGDRDNDVVSASASDDKIAWYENVDTIGDDGIGDGEVWIEHLISDTVLGARALAAGFLGGSGAGKSDSRAEVQPGRERPPQAGQLPVPDLFAASFDSGTITTYANLTGTWIERTVTSGVAGASSVAVADVDDDFCPDVLTTSETDGRVLWVGVSCDAATFLPAQVIDGNLPGARSVIPADLNPDFSFDVVAAGFDSGEVVAYLNAGRATAWNRVVITDLLVGPTALAIANFDFDSDLDVVVADALNDTIVWYENVDGIQVPGDGTNWAPHPVTSQATGVSSIAVDDLDFDEDEDIVAALAGSGELVWYENTNGDGSAWTPHRVRPGLTGASSVALGDLNGDFQRDVAGAAFDIDTVAWSPNQSGLFPGVCGDGTLDAFERCDPPGAQAGASGNTCRLDCTVCGDGVIDQNNGEQCDDGNANDQDACSNACTINPSFRKSAGSRSAG